VTVPELVADFMAKLEEIDPSIKAATLSAMADGDVSEAQPEERRKVSRNKRRGKAKKDRRFTDAQFAAHKKARETMSQGEVHALLQGEAYKGFHCLDVRAWVWGEGTAKPMFTPRRYGGKMTVKRENQFYTDGWKWSYHRKNWFHMCGVMSRGRSKTDPRLAGVAIDDD
jgi:hypothetical protein